MSYTFAGTYGPNQIITPTGTPEENLPIYVYLHGTTTLATLYTDRTKATTAANPTKTDALGNLTFYADPAQYDITGNNETLTVTLYADPAELATTIGAASGLATLDSSSHVTSSQYAGPGWPQARGSELRAARAAWANRGSAPMNILVVGDSVEVGYFADASTDSWPNIVYQRLATTNGQNGAGSLGYYAIDWSGHAQVAYTGRYWTFTGTQPTFNTDLGLGYGNVSIPNGTTVVSPSVVCDRLWVHYPQFAGVSGQLDVYIDGVFQTTLTLGGQAATKGGRVWDSGSLTLASHQVTLEPHTSTTTRAEGVTFFSGNGGSSGTNGSGVRLFNGSHFGYQTSSFAASGVSSWWTDGLDSMLPQLVLIYLGINDQAAAVSTAQYQANIAAIINQINSVVVAAGGLAPSYVLCVPYGTGANSSLSPPYQAALRTAAATNGCAFFDLEELLGYLGTGGDPYGLTQDNKHPKTVGHRLIGEAMADYLLRMFGPTGSSTSAPSGAAGGDLSGNYPNPTVAQLNGVAAASYPTLTSTSTLTNKRVTKRVTATSGPGATPTINTDNCDVVNLTAIATNITSMTTNLSGTPVAGDTLRIAFTDNGTPATIAWGTSFEASTVALPTTTVASTRMDVGFVWNTATSKWRCVGTA